VAGGSGRARRFNFSRVLSARSGLTDRDFFGDIPILEAVSAIAAEPTMPVLVGRCLRTTHQEDAKQDYRPWVAGIIGAGRSWTAWTISVLSIPRRYTEVIARSACPSWR
jgi:hypothetical protein